MTKTYASTIASCAVWLSLMTLPTRAQNPQWIWNDNKGKSIKTNEVRFFRKVFEVDSRPTRALLSVAADDDAKVYLNGKEVSHTQGYDKPNYEDLTAEVKNYCVSMLNDALTLSSQ